MSELLSKYQSNIKRGIVRFVYQKSSGVMREAYGVMHWGAIEKWKRAESRSKIPFKKGKVSVTTYFDLVANDWRCFITDNLKEVGDVLYLGDSGLSFQDYHNILKEFVPSAFAEAESPVVIHDDYEVKVDTSAEGTTDTTVATMFKKKEKKDTLSRMLVKWPVPTIEASGFYVTSFTWRSLLSNIYNKVNTLMVGPAGTGKTELVRFVCQQMGLNYSHYNIGSMTDVQASLIGSHVIDEHGHSQFAYAQFVEDIQKPGIVMLDELNRNPQALNVLTNVLDGIRELNISGTGSSDSKRIKVHPSCVFFATANIGASYTGTSMIDEALETRFDFIGVDYIPDVYETELLVKRTGVRNEDAKTISSFAKQIRQLYAKEEISKSISTRETIRIAQKVSIGNTLKDAVKSILERFEGTDSEGERGIVHKIIAGV